MRVCSGSGSMPTRRRADAARSVPHHSSARPSREGNDMMLDMIRGRWTHLRGKLQQRWNKLTDEDINRRDGHRDYLINKLQERYGIPKEKARMEVKEFERTLR